MPSMMLDAAHSSPGRAGLMASLSTSLAAVRRVLNQLLPPFIVLNTAPDSSAPSGPPVPA